jgi:hypothetical protein
MKKIGKYTTRGILPTSDLTAHRIQLFDGRYDTGYRITRFDISVSNRDNSGTVIASGKLMTEAATNNRTWNWGLNTEVAWASASWDGNDRYAVIKENYIDPDNMIIEDLFIGMHAYGDEGQEINYIIEMDKYDVTEWQGALSMVRNSAQNV